MAPYKLHYDSSQGTEPSLTRRKASSRLPTKAGSQLSAQSSLPMASTAIPSSSPSATSSTLSKMKTTDHTQVIPRIWEMTESERAHKPVPSHDSAQPLGIVGAPPLPESYSQSTSSNHSHNASKAYPSAPSLTSGSSASTGESPNLSSPQPGPEHLNAFTNHSLRGPTDSDSPPAERIPATYTSIPPKDPFSESLTVHALSPPPVTSRMDNTFRRGVASPGLQAIEPNLSTHTPIMANTELLPPVMVGAFSASPSTRYSESPGPFSHSSTPTSMSSYSPAFSMSIKPGSRARQSSPTRSRPPVTRKNTDDSLMHVDSHGLPPLRESTTSSSSNSTLKAAEGGKQTTTQKHKTKKSRLPAPPPSPPPRKSSMHSPGARQKRGKGGQPDVEKSTEQSVVQAPPELAHLTTASPPEPLIKVPSRPSRDGAPPLVDPRGPSPIVQSNMTSLPTFAHRRSSSTESKMSGIFPPPSPRSRLGLPRRMLSPSPYGSARSPSEATQDIARPATSASTPERSNEREGRKLRKAGNQISAAGPSRSPAKFGFFSRRAKTEPIPKPEKEKATRKGPMAGTGHEGYGKYALRGRSGSNNTSNASVGRSASADSNAGSLAHTVSSRQSSMTSGDGSDMDNFLLDRLAPVVIRGEGSATESVVSEDDQEYARPQLTKNWAGANSSLSSFGTMDSRGPGVEAAKPTLLPSAMAYSARGRSPFHGSGRNSRRPSESGDDDDSFCVPSGVGRSPARVADDADNAAHSAPVRDGSTSGNLHAVVSNKSNPADLDPQGLNVDTSKHQDGKGGGWLKSRGKEIRSKVPKKWNFFQRAQASPKKDDNIAEVPVTVARLQPSRTIAHYAMLDATGQVDMADLERLMEEADRSQEEISTFKAYPVSQPGQNVVRFENAHSMLLPSPPSFTKTFPMPPKTSLEETSPITDGDKPNSFAPLDKIVSHTSDEFPHPSEVAQSEVNDLYHDPPKPTSRLVHVGRIPQVTPRSEQGRKLPNQSFSRPFVPTRPKPNMQSPQSASSSTSEVPISATDSVSSPPPINTIEPFKFDLDSASQNAAFLAFPPRRTSDMSCSTSSGGFPFPNLTAIVPAPDAPLSEDEVWNEYDDLLDGVLSEKQSGPDQAALATASDDKVTGHASTHECEKRSQQASTRLSHYKSHSMSSTSSGSRRNTQRRSRLLSSLHSAVVPTSPYSITEFLAGYGERNLSGIDQYSGRISASEEKAPQSGGSVRSSIRSSSARGSETSSQASRSQDDAKTKKSYRDTRLIEIAETQNDGLVSMANLRFGALMTSKWLSFGRVLFSPAHSELKSISEDRVLILDGLGKDWSYYCALTYPQAAVYSLGPSPTEASQGDGKDANAWQSLPNHRHIHHESFANPFPFPRDFFAAVVFRFPIAASEPDYRAAIFECKRVLRPGGYLEISVLDIDMLNMGNSARRAVRGLKMAMQAADPSISLKPLSDSIQRMLGRRGFENLNRCVVGVPVAGTISESRETSLDGSGMSFSDLLKEGSSASSTSSKKGDDHITKMVARVGRWWYSRCYEMVVLQDGDMRRSIWADKALLRECEDWQTSFRLLICYAQKPTIAPRRTASV